MTKEITEKTIIEEYQSAMLQSMMKAWQIIISRMCLMFSIDIKIDEKDKIMMSAKNQPRDVKKLVRQTGPSNIAFHRISESKIT